MHWLNRITRILNQTTQILRFNSPPRITNNQSGTDGRDVLVVVLLSQFLGQILGGTTPKSHFWWETGNFDILWKDLLEYDQI